MTVQSGLGSFGKAAPQQRWHTRHCDHWPQRDRDEHRPDPCGAYQPTLANSRCIAAIARASVLVVYCDDVEVDKIANAIIKMTHTSNNGDGIVVVNEIARLYRVRDGGGGA